MLLKIRIPIWRFNQWRKWKKPGKRAAHRPRFRFHGKVWYDAATKEGTGNFDNCFECHLIARFDVAEL